MNQRPRFRNAVRHSPASTKRQYVSRPLVSTEILEGSEREIEVPSQVSILQRTRDKNWTGICEQASVHNPSQLQVAKRAPRA